MTLMAAISGLARAAARLTAAVAAGILAALVLLLAWSGLLGALSAVGAGGLGGPPLWVTETAEFGLLPIGFLGAALALRARAHQGIDALTRLFPARLERATDRFVWIVTGVFGGVFAWLGVLYVLSAYRVGGVLASADVPKWPFYLCYPVSGLLMAIFSLEGLLGTLRRKAAAGAGGEAAAEGDRP